MKPTISTLVAASTLALLSACGGSGDDGSGAQPVGPEGLSITTANETAVTRATVVAGLSVSDIESETNVGGSGVQPTSLTARTHSLATVLHRALAAGVRPRMGIASASVHPAAVSNDTEPCGVSGSITATFNDKDNDQQLSAGDVLTVAFNQCRDTATSVYNGTAVVTLATVPTADQITGSVAFQGLSSVEGGLTSTVNGSLTLSEIDSDTGSNTTLTAGGDGLAITLASASYNDSVTLQTGMVVTINQVFAANRTSLTFNGILSAQSFTGGATLTTVTPIVQLDADAFPSSGVIKAQGLHGTLLITVMNATTVQLQLDADGDGSYENTTTTPWTSLVPQ